MKFIKDFIRKTLAIGKPAYFFVFASVLLTAPFTPSEPGVFSSLPGFGVVHVARASTSTQGSMENSQSMQLLASPLASDLNPSLGGGSVTIVDDRALVNEGGVSEPSVVSADETKDHAYGGEVSIYVVREGDTLSNIAKMFNVSVNTVRWANSIGKGEDIHVGQTLIILPITGVEHRVVKGDTISSIAKKYHADATDILYYNNLSEGESLEVGQKVIIPDGEIAAPPVTHRSASSEKSAPAQAYRAETQAGNGLLLGYFIEPLKHFVKTQGIHGHNGVDLAAPVGTPIYAAASGDVIVSRNNGGWNGGYGNFVVINHPNGEQTLYAHMSSDIVAVGQHVVQGQVIGYIGVTGHTTGPHVHVEVHGGRNPF